MGPPDALARQMVARVRAASALPHLSAPAGVTADDEAAFRRFAIELTADHAVVGSAIMILVILVWWPIDWLIKPDARYLDVFAILRARGLVVEVVTLALFLGSRRARRASLVLGPVLYAALLGCVGYSLGSLGGPDLSWLADAIFGVLPFALVPLHLGPRVAATLLVGLSLPLGFFVPFPGNLHAPAARGQVSFIVFALFATIVLGDILFRLLRGSFFHQRALDRARAGHAELAASLASRVKAQTRELRELAAQIVRAREAERHRISRDLHDELAQELTAMRYTLARIDERRGADPESVADLVGDIAALLDGATATVRGFIGELRPRALDSLGLVAAVERLFDRIRASSEVECRLTVARGFLESEGGVEPALALTLFRVIQEATTNAWRHAQPSVIDVSLTADGDEIAVEVRDDGVGFDPAAPSAGFGLLGIRERVLAKGGGLSLESAPGRGTLVRAVVPARLARISGRPRGGAMDDSMEAG